MFSFSRDFLMISLVLFLSFLGCASQIPSSENQVCFNNRCLQVEVAQKEEDLMRGLMNRPHLSENTGMLFIFHKMGEYSFWMKDTLIPLDIIWLDHARRIVDIAVDVPVCAQEPCASYTPSKEALYVLEMNARHSKVMGLKIGDEAQFKLKGL